MGEREQSHDRQRSRYTVDALRVGPDAWHVSVRELPNLWTVAFTDIHPIDRRVKALIADELGSSRDAIELVVVLEGESEREYPRPRVLGADD